MTDSWGPSFEAFQARLAQISEAFQATFLSLGRPADPPAHVGGASRAGSQDGSDNDDDDDEDEDAEEGGDLDCEGDRDTEAKVGKGDARQALMAELARRGLAGGGGGGGGEAAPPAASPDQLSIIAEVEELESLRSMRSMRSLAASRCSEAHSAVSSFGNDGEHTSSSDSEDDVAKQFEMSVSRSQSFRTSGNEANATPAAPGRHHKFSRLVSDQEDGTTEPSDCEDGDSVSQRSFKDPLTSRPVSRTGATSDTRPIRDPLSACRDADRDSLASRDTVDGQEGERTMTTSTNTNTNTTTTTPALAPTPTPRERGSSHSSSRVNSRASSRAERRGSGSGSGSGAGSGSSRPASRTGSRAGSQHHSRHHHRTSTSTPDSLEMVESMAMDNQAYDHDATDSSSTCWSPEQEQPPGDPLSLSPRTPISKCGELVVLLDYLPGSSKLRVTVVMARGIPDKARSGMDTWQVHAVLLPAKRQRHKTVKREAGSAKHGTKDTECEFGDTFRFGHLESAELPGCALRLRLYAQGRMSRERMMGEAVYRLSKLNTSASTGGETQVILTLEPRSNLRSAGSLQSLSAVSQSDSASSNQSLAHGGAPELLLGLAYNPTTGRLAVELIKGSHFRNLALNRPPDTYGKLTLLNSMGQEISRCKTSVRRGQPNPVYKETFVFQVALFQLSDVTLMVSIYTRRNMKRKEMVGWLALGQNSSGREELLHWQDMRESGNQQVCRWHPLLEG